MAVIGEPPEITEAALAAADKLWTSLEKDMPDSIDLGPVKPLVIHALRLAFSHGALFVSRVGLESLERMRDKKPRRPFN